jgi:UDP-N-acetylmuramate: L-alanyl-gamma-D-glutamyl-meso-diaminopimelate ligase
MKAHFIAIGGSAMHNLALALSERGDTTITGSDDAIFEPSRSRLAAAGILPAAEGWFPEKITKDLDAIVLGMHARADNPELLRAQALGLPIFSYPEYLYESTKGKTRVVIGGSHGKTSTTSMLLHALRLDGMDIDYMVGAQLAGYQTMVRLSNTAEWAVFEGDEYLSSPIDLRPKFHLYQANVAILTGMAWDHVNVFPAMEDYERAFTGFLATMEPGGTLIYNEEDEALTSLVLADQSPLRKIPYQTPSYRIENNQWIWETPEGDLPLRIMGRHNLSNAEGARWLAQEMGVQAVDFYDAMATFEGAQRRLEVLAESDFRRVHLDFAHAPSKVKATVAAYVETFAETAGLLELHTFSSLNPAFIPGYAGTMEGLDHAMVFFDPEAVAHKKLPALDPSWVQATFGPNVHVFTTQDEVKAALASLPEQCNVLIMSSGNMGGIDVRTWAPSWV